MNIYIHKEGTNYGPYSIEQVKEYVLQGSFTLQDNACHDGQNWIPVAQLPGMAPVSPSPGPQSSNAPTQSEYEYQLVYSFQTVNASGLGHVAFIQQPQGPCGPRCRRHKK